MDPVTFSDAGTAPLGLVHFYPMKQAYGVPDSPTPRLMLYNAQSEPLKEVKEGKGCTQCGCLPELLFWPICCCPPQFEKNVGGQHLAPFLGLHWSPETRPWWLPLLYFGDPRVDFLKP